MKLHVTLQASPESELNVEVPGVRREFVAFCVISTLAVPVIYLISQQPGYEGFRHLFWLYLILVPTILGGIYDMIQVKHAIRRNFPVVGRFRYWLETIRPEIHQYFVEGNNDGDPFSRERRSVIYQRAKQELSTLPFGTQRDVYAVGYEWVNHSLAPKHLEFGEMRVMIGGPDCKQPYSASLFNISAMSFGSLSSHAVMALNGGAKKGNFAHNTGEGSISQWHKKPGGDLIWQLGTGYFGCRNPDGTFNPEMFRENANHESVKMIEIKLSQGAKPGHGGILPAKKITPEIAKIRGVELGKDVISPPAHSAFSTPMELLEFIVKLRELSGGKPVGFKLCVGKRREFLAICKAMIEMKVYPDFISVDGGEGGTGAAPLEFSNHIGCPLTEGLIFVHNALTGFGLRDKVRLIASGKITTAFDIIRMIAIGADLCYAARAMMLALGCIQAVKCNTNTCPVGIATQNPNLIVGLDVPSKTDRIYNYHRSTLMTAMEMLGAMGLNSSDELQPWHIVRRTGPLEIKHYGEIFTYLREGELLLEDKLPKTWERAHKAASAESFDSIDAAAA